MRKLRNSKIYKPYRSKLRNQLTKPEATLWNYLKGSGLGFKFRRQHSIGKYIVDFFCPELDFVIELDGETHGLEQRMARDKEMDQFLKNNGFTILRFTKEGIKKLCLSLLPKDNSIKLIL